MEAEMTAKKGITMLYPVNIIGWKVDVRSNTRKSILLEEDLEIVECSFERMKLKREDGTFYLVPWGNIYSDLENDFYPYVLIDDCKEEM